MKNNSVQDLGILIFFVAFTLLAGSLTAGGNILLVVLALAGAGGSALIFFSLKPRERSGSFADQSVNLPENNVRCSATPLE